MIPFGLLMLLLLFQAAAKNSWMAVWTVTVLMTEKQGGRKENMGVARYLITTVLEVLQLRGVTL